MCGACNEKRVEDPQSWNSSTRRKANITCGSDRGYKYLGVLEKDTILHEQMKKKLK